MSAQMKSWLIGSANAAISGLAAGSAGMAVGIGFKKSAIVLGVSAAVSLVKWLAQHPIPGGTQ